MTNQRDDRPFSSLSTFLGTPWDLHSQTMLPDSAVYSFPQSSLPHYSHLHQHSLRVPTGHGSSFLLCDVVDQCQNSNDDGCMLHACRDQYLVSAFHWQTHPLPGDPVLCTRTDLSSVAVAQVEPQIQQRQNPIMIYPLLTDPASLGSSASGPPLVAGSHPNTPYWQRPTTNFPLTEGTLPDLPVAGSSLVVGSRTNVTHGGYIVHPPPAQPCWNHLHCEGPIPDSHDTSRTHTHEAHLFPCRWLHGDNVPCEFFGSLDELKKHFTAVHLPRPQDAPIKCHWEGCDYYRRSNPAVNTMRLDSLWRHILEMHLGIKYRKKV